MYYEDKTYKDFPGPLGAAPFVWAECLLVDPIADIAVLGTPDTQELIDQAEAYEKFIEGLTTLEVADLPPDVDEHGFVLSIEGNGCPRSPALRRTFIVAWSEPDQRRHVWLADLERDRRGNRGSFTQRRV
jgi:hypothetical protein